MKEKSAQAKFVAWVRKEFSQSIIHRNPRSVDWQGKPIGALYPVQEHPLTLSLSAWEVANMERLRTKKANSKKSQKLNKEGSFYNVSFKF